MGKRKSGVVDELNPRQLRFCEEYVVDLDATKAAARAGYSAKTAKQSGARLLSHLTVQRKIQTLKMIRSDAVASRAEDVIKEVALLAHSDIKDFLNVDDAGVVTPKRLSELAPGQSRCIKRIKQRRVIRRTADGTRDTIEETTLEFELWDKPKCLDLEGQYHTLWNQKASGLSEDDAAAALARIADAMERRDGSPAAG